VWTIIDHNEHGGTHKEHEQCGRSNAALLQYGRRQSRFIPSIKLKADKDDNHQSESDKESNDHGTFPCVLRPSPLKCDGKTHDRATINLDRFQAR